MIKDWEKFNESLNESSREESKNWFNKISSGEEGDILKKYGFKDSNLTPIQIEEIWNKEINSDLNKLLLILKDKLNLIDLEFCNIDKDLGEIEIYNIISDKNFEYFLDNHIALKIDPDGYLNIYYHMYEEEIDHKEAKDVKEYLNDKLSPYFKNINHIE